MKKFHFAVIATYLRGIYNNSQADSVTYKVKCEITL